MSAQRMTAALQGHLRMAGLPDHFTMHSFRVGGSVTKSLAGTAVDEIMKIGGWKTESIAKYYIESTTSTGVRASKRTRDHGYARANEFYCCPRKLSQTSHARRITPNISIIEPSLGETTQYPAAKKKGRTTVSAHVLAHRFHGGVRLRY